MRIESKEQARARGVPSPDRAEALMLALGKLPWKFEYYSARNLPLAAERQLTGHRYADDDDDRFPGARRWDAWAPGEYSAPTWAQGLVIGCLAAGASPQPKNFNSEAFPPRRNRAMCVEYDEDLEVLVREGEFNVKPDELPAAAVSVSANGTPSARPSRLPASDQTTKSQEKKTVAAKPANTPPTNTSKKAHRPAQSSRAAASEKLVCRYCGSDDLAPSFVKRRDARCRSCFKQRYGSSTHGKTTVETGKRKSKATK
jgi:hypothetical protein